jgi:prepilin-type processing-associated H-X9-DG protein
VELLVVIGIIALLIAILLPALSRARQAANTLKCAANVRSISQAANLYATDWKGWIPRDNFATGNFFATKLSKYLAGPPIPSTKWGDVNYLYNVYNQMPIYQCPAMKDSGFALTYTISSIDLEYYRKTRAYVATWGAKVVRAPRIAEVVYLAEINPGEHQPRGFGTWDIWSDTHVPFIGTAANARPRMIHAKDRRHLGKTNVGFLDGHAETRSLTPGDLPIRTFNPYDPR